MSFGIGQMFVLAEKDIQYIMILQHSNLETTTPLLKSIFSTPSIISNTGAFAQTPMMNGVLLYQEIAQAGRESQVMAIRIGCILIRFK